MAGKSNICSAFVDGRCQILETQHRLCCLQNLGRHE
uniref:Uncharacterized protein n=1 Tax=Picea sitchensis TaxID=3332 RepID=D5A7Y2_PICSI|nr:unknown [Picea sitchensis]